jgi:nitrite reductase (NADH) large subunit
VGEPLIIVGNGMAAARLVKELSTRALGRYSILVIGDEPRPAYNRVLLSSLLAGDVDEDAIELAPRDWWREQGVSTLFGRRVTSVDRATKTIALSDGVTLPYSKLVLATGSQAIRLPSPGMTLPGVITFRDMADIDAMRQAAGRKARAVVIGGGLLGIEAAYGLQRGGAKVTLLHLMDQLMERQLDARAGALLKAEIERKGIEVILGADTQCVEGQGHAEAIVLKDGRRIATDLVVCAIGIRPNVTLAKDAEIEVKRAIVVDDGLATRDPDIFAIGECAEHRGVCYGLVEPAYDQARVLAARLAGDRTAAYAGSTLATNLKVSGVKVFSAGAFAGAAGTERIVYSDMGAGIYKSLTLDGDKLVGAVLYGDTADALWHLDLIRQGAPVSDLRDTLAFGPSSAMPLAA